MEAAAVNPRPTPRPLTLEIRFTSEPPDPADPMADGFIDIDEITLNGERIGSRTPQQALRLDRLALALLEEVRIQAAQRLALPGKS